MIDNIVMSNNGILFHDLKPLRYCNLFGTIITPTLKECRQCGQGIDVIKITQEKREMFLDSLGFVNEINNGKDDPVTAELTLATVKEGGKTEKRIVQQRFEGAKKCPKYLI